MDMKLVEIYKIIWEIGSMNEFTPLIMEALKKKEKISINFLNFIKIKEQKIKVRMELMWMNKY